MPYRATQLRALVADPTPHMADLVGQMLRALGIRDAILTHTVADTTAALANADYDLVLLDSELGKGRGLTCVAHLRQTPNHRNHATPVIMMGVSPSAAMIAAARDAGVNEFLRKPFSAQHIKLRLDAIRNSSRVFLETPVYVGPDRRRQERPVSSDRRTKSSPTGSAS